jgi:site-specific DNA recombinase
MEGGKEMNRAFTIVRVSAEDQLKGYGPDVQWEDDILPSAAVLGLTTNETYRRVIQESATGWERTKFETAVREALSLYNRGEIEALLFPRVDRETRFIFGSMPLLAEVVKSGLRVYFARERLALNPDDPESIERYLNKATQAQAYVQTMKLNTSRAKKRLLKEGKLPQGTGVGLFGYNWNRDTKRRDINATEADVLREIFDRIAAGEAPVAVARELNRRLIHTKGTKPDAKLDEIKHWHSLTIRRMIRNPSYIGKTYFGMTTRIDKGHTVSHPRESWTLLGEVTPALVSEEVFNKANAQLDRPKSRTGQPKHTYLLRHRVFCGVCGRPMVGHCVNHKYLYYQCSGARPIENSEPKCRALFVRAAKLEQIVWDNMKQILSHPEIMIAELREQFLIANHTTNASAIDAQIKETEASLRECDRRRSNLLPAIEIDGFDKDEILDRLNNLKQQRGQDEERLTQLLQLKANLSRLTTAKPNLSEVSKALIARLENCTPDDKHLALEMLDIQVYATADKIEINGVVPVALSTTEQTSA